VARNLAEWCAVDLRGEGRELERVAESPDGGARPKTGTEVVVPLVGREGPLGALTFGWDAPDRTASPEELGLAEDLCRRAALAVENARLYAERTHVARILQQSLLPDRLPAIEGLEVDARLHAAGQAVGGDFYDLFEIGDGRWGFVLGDVCGKGVDAARLTALTRYTVRAASMRIASPDGVLEVLNDVLLRDRAGDVNLCTVAFAVITVEEGRVTLELTNGGHPLPLRIAGGRVDSAGGPGTILGAFREPDLTTLRLTLGRGDTLVFYTDGVIEAKDPAREVFGEPRLRDLLAELRDAPPDEVTAAIVEAALRFQAGKVRDDIAVVAFRVPSA
ncbi:MAG TPA: GAF domain-containing SpoIIE family protein phosphatase, partial [Actinomycetota bacterium]|nr:GAF domain-containing SpoIIE family protein phosphatase [Actinomycetota bacterium]